MGEKFEQSKSKDELKVGKEKKTFKQSVEVLLTFRENRTFELHVNRQLIRFEGRQTIKLPKAITEHADFTVNIAKNFIIKEVK